MGLSLGLPTGSGHLHGTEENTEPDPLEHHHEENIYRFSPFFNIGIQAGDLELVGWTLFNIPTNQEHPEDATTGLEYNISALYHLSPRIQPLLEFTGTRQLSGVVISNNMLYLAPGLRVQLLKETPLVLGLGVRLPVTEARNFDTQVKVSAFFHF